MTWTAWAEELWRRIHQSRDSLRGICRLAELCGLPFSISALRLLSIMVNNPPLLSFARQVSLHFPAIRETVLSLLSASESCKTSTNSPVHRWYPK